MFPGSQKHPNLSKYSVSVFRFNLGHRLQGLACFLHLIMCIPGVAVQTKRSKDPCDYL